MFLRVLQVGFSVKNLRKSDKMAINNVKMSYYMSIWRRKGLFLKWHTD